MDPVTALGVATGVIGLIPLCGQGFDFVSSVFSAKQDLNDCAFELDVERRKYIGWRTTLGLEGVSERDAPGVLKRKIPEGQHAVVLGCLVGISNAFTNAKFLESCGFRQTNNDVPRYAVTTDLPFEPKAWKGNTRVLIEQRKTHMNLLRRCKFVLRDGKKFTELSAKLRRYLSTIFGYCTWEFMQVFWSASMPEQILKPRQETNYMEYDPAEMVQQLGKSLRRNDNQQQREGLSLLARAAEFSARVKKVEGLKFRPIEDNFKVYSSEWAVLNQGGEIGTMAVGRSTDPTNVYYVEWKSYRTYGGVTEAQLVANIGSLVKIAKIPAPSEFRLLPCLGAFKASDQRYGLVYDLPAHLKAIWDPRWSTGDVSRSRKPRNLLSLIQESESYIPEELDLGSRIAFIRKVAQSLLLLHAVGWVHKNICSQSIIFFLARSGYTNGPSTSGRLDFDNPYICGFGESRPEDPEDYDKAVRRRKTPAKIPGRSELFTTTREYDEPTKQAMMQNPYQHPHKRLNPHNLYRSSFDVYSLGCVMLEVGLWQDIRSIEPRYQSDAKRFRDRLIRVAEQELPGQVGKIYANATRSCLEIRETGKTEEHGQRVLRKIIDDLSRCVI